MSGSSDAIDCPRCNGENTLMIFSNSRPYPQEDGNCLQCGLSYQTVESLNSIEEVNENRLSMGLSPLTELVKPVSSW